MAAERDSVPSMESRLQGFGPANSQLVIRPGKRIPSGIEAHLVSLLTPTTPEAEQYRSLRHIVERLHKGTGLSVMAVSSPAAGDGKTTTAINLAGSLAQARENRVLLVDVDLRRPSVSRCLALDTVKGQNLISAILDANLSLDTVVKQCVPWMDNLSVLSAGGHLANPYELLKSARFADLVKDMRQCYDYVVFDTPPLIPFPDCQILEEWVDGFLIVMTPYKTPRKLAEEALSVIAPAKIIGLVSNNDNRPALRYHYSSYHAYNSSSDTGAPLGDARAVERPSLLFSRTNLAWLVGLVLLVGLVGLLSYRDVLSEKWQGQPTVNKDEPREKGPEAVRQAAEGGPAQARMQPSSEEKKALAVAERATPASQPVPPPEQIGKKAELREPAFPVTRIIKKGDTLKQLTAEIYGSSTQKRVEWVLKNNPHIHDTHNLRIGEKILFPAEAPPSVNSQSGGLLPNQRPG